MKFLLIMIAALMLPIVPALACFPEQGDEVLFASEGRSFDRNPIPMSYCDSGEVGFVIVNGKCYDFDAITDYDTEEECQADPVCKAYREQQDRDRPCEEYHVACQNDAIAPPAGLIPPEPDPGDPYTCDNEGKCIPVNEDPNHGEIKGDEELEDEEEHQEEEEQGQEQGESEETASTTDE